MKEYVLTNLKEYKENQYNEKLKEHLKKYIDYDELSFIENEIHFFNSCYKTTDINLLLLILQYELKNIEDITTSYWRRDNELAMTINIEVYKIILCEIIVFDGFFDSVKREQLEHTYKRILSFLNDKREQLITQPLQLTTKTKTNKSLLFNGSQLNLSERFKIANEVLNIDNKIRTLNISELEKYQLLAYILGCDKDNARNLMNGTYKTKDRDLSNYFDSLDLNR